MRDRALWTFVALAVLALAAAYWLRRQTRPAPPAATPATAALPATPPPPSAAPTTTPPQAVSVTIPPPPAPAAKTSKPEVAIQEGKTIDFSSGVAVIKDDARQKAIIDKSVKEMESALQDVTFGPPAPKPAEPAPTKP
jgi:hypothetical protein